LTRSAHLPLSRPAGEGAERSEAGEGPAAPLRTRLALPADAAAIAAIYNQGIADRVATFETEPRRPEQILAWLGGRHPVVVVERGDDLFAWAACSAYRGRPCYDGVAEFSVYVDRAHRGRGAGRAAMAALMTAAAEAGLWKLVSRVFVENRASRAMLRGLGFREVGVYERHARLDGAWRDVVVVEALLGAAAGPATAQDLAAADLPGLAAALAAAGLPSSDVAAPGRRFWRFLDRTGAVVGFGGLELAGAHALLRSVVVLEGGRGRGVGRAIVAATVRRAAWLGADRLWLLTTTAPGFFERLGFERADRTAAPPAIAATTEFATLCPATAICLTKPLA